MDKKALRQLALSTVRKQGFDNYSANDVEDAFRAEMRELICYKDGKINNKKWRKNKDLVFDLMEEMADVVLPKRVQGILGFAEFKQFNDGDKPRFLTARGKTGIKRFVTRVAAAGTYDRVRLDRDYFDMEMYAHGGAVFQSFEAFLAGRDSISEVFNLLLEQLEHSVYEDVATALNGTVSDLPAANKHTHGSFEEAQFNRILSTVRAYGTPVIYCTQEFAASLIPSANFIGEADKADMRNQGYIGRYLGSDLVILPQSFTDHTNSEKVIDPQYCYIMPAGSADSRPVKVGFEGGLKVRQPEREDWSTEIQCYQKLGVAIINTNHFGIYQNTELAS